MDRENKIRHKGVPSEVSRSETVHNAVKQDLELRQDYQRLKFRRGHAVAKVAIARKLAVRMYWMLRTGADYAQMVRRQGSPGGTLMNANSSLA
jgi:hypothetical protein